MKKLTLLLVLCLALPALAQDKALHGKDLRLAPQTAQPTNLGTGQYGIYVDQIYRALRYIVNGVSSFVVTTQSVATGGNYGVPTDKLISVGDGTVSNGYWIPAYSECAGICAQDGLQCGPNPMPGCPPCGACSAGQVCMNGTCVGGSPTWTALSLGFNWSLNAYPTAPNGYYKDANQIVHITGSINSPTFYYTSEMFTLPAGFCPASPMTFTVPADDAGNYLAVVVGPDLSGNSGCQVAAPSAQYGSDVRLDGISFQANSSGSSCVSTCGARLCGMDSCGHPSACGSCNVGYYCSPAGTCVSTCAHQCGNDGLSCGQDPVLTQCFCGGCPPGKTCGSLGSCI